VYRAFQVENNWLIFNREDSTWLHSIGIDPEIGYCCEVEITLDPPIHKPAWLT
jgi:hypothetical protein